MDLILWRHAEAVNSDKQGDAACELTPKGRKQAKRMAAWLRDRLKGRYVLLISPTMRARQTAAALSEKYEVGEDFGTRSGARRIIKAAGWPEAEGTVIIVGHRPGLNRAASLLLTGLEREWEIKKGGIWWLQSRAEGDPAFVRAVMSPRDLP